MAFSEINDRDAEQIVGGVRHDFQTVGQNHRVFQPAFPAPRIGLMRNVMGAATGGAYTSLVMTPPPTRVWYGQMLGNYRANAG